MIRNSMVSCGESWMIQELTLQGHTEICKDLGRIARKQVTQHSSLAGKRCVSIGEELLLKIVYIFADLGRIA